MSTDEMPEVVTRADPDEPLRPGADLNEPARCALRGCGERLHIVHTVSMPILFGDTAAVLADPANGTTAEWQVQCEAGHVVLLPLDMGADTYVFGRCTCDHDVPGWCEHEDMNRLRKVIAPEPRRRRPKDSSDKGASHG